MPANPEKVIHSIRDAGLQPPEMLTLMITGGCNLQCRHCRLDCGPDSAAGPVPLNVVCGIIDDFTRLGGTGLTLTGGEVLTHPDWFEILVFACDRSALKEVCLQTNAMLMTRHMAAELSALSSVKLSIQISMDGGTSAKSQGLVRGKGSFNWVLRGLDCLLDAGMGPRIRIAFTEMAHNADLPLWAQLPVMARKRRETFENCRGCPGEAHCLGGCMGRAYAVCGDLLSVEDRCALRRAVYRLG